ncbi:MAG: hypothetical protein KBG02_05445 [Haliscomenobacter sp.]|nr:hypothetical protein [Haliscomenobacter sp.]
MHWNSSLSGLKGPFFCKGLHGWPLMAVACLLFPFLATGRDSGFRADTLNIPCVAPADTSVFCTDPAVDQPGLLGQAFLPEGTPDGVVLEELPLQSNLFLCRTGSLIRSWQVIQNKGTVQEYKGQVCTQEVESKPLHHYVLYFPPDTTLTCAGLNKADSAFFSSSTCDALSLTVQDVRVNLPGESCFKIYRTYRVINWCEYDGRSNPVLISRDADGDGKPGDEGIWCTVLPDGHSYWDKDQDPFNGVPNARGYWTGSRINGFLASNGYWEYQQVIQMVDNAPPLLNAPESVQVAAKRSDCTGDVNFSIQVSEACTPEDLVFTLDLDRFSDGISDGNIASSLVGTYPRYRLVYKMPIGEHSLRLTVQDRCGNVTEKTIRVTVTDSRAPAPMCINSLVLSLNPVAPGLDIDADGDTDSGAATIWVEDLLSGQLTDCSGPLKFSIHRGEWIESGVETPAPGQDFLVVTCDDRPTVLAYVYAWDVNGNGGYCETLILLQDPGKELCAEIGNGSVSGTVRTVQGYPVDGAELILEGDRIEPRRTGPEGTYVFEFLKQGDYQIRPRLDSSYKEGVTTYDIVKILRHILGEEKFESPYQYLAADVDLSGSVTTLDIIQIRRLVLSVEIDFRQTPSWRFIPAGYQFANPDDPLKESFPEVRSFYGLSGKILDADFVGIKMGDVTGDALSGNPGPAVLIQSPQRVRSGQEEESAVQRKRRRNPNR